MEAEMIMTFTISQGLVLVTYFIEFPAQKIQHLTMVSIKFE